MRVKKSKIFENTKLKIKIRKRKQKGIIFISQCEDNVDSQMKSDASLSFVFNFVKYLHNVIVQNNCILYESPQLISRKECNQINFIL